MAGRYLFDTNIIIALFANDVLIQEKLKEDIEIFIPAIAIGELYFGAFNSSKVDENVKKIDDFVNKVILLKSDNKTAKEYGKIKSHLKSKGNPIPENDVWISAVALQHNLVLVTRDKHFQKIDILKVEVW